MTKKNARMRSTIIAWSCFFISVASFGLNAQVKDEAELNQILSKMDTASKAFQSFKARISLKKYTAILKEFDVPETGQFYYARTKEGVPLVRLDFISPGKKIVTVKGDKAIIYQPDIKQAQIANLGNYKNYVEIIAIGIGQSQAKLERDFYLSCRGSESINGESCSILILKPKDAKLAARVLSFTLWVKKSNGILVHNKILEPNGDYTLLTFFDEILNVKMPNSLFEQKLPNDVDKQNMGI
jgi:outer membrane lipoprotein-sorting protein